MLITSRHFSRLTKKIKIQNSSLPNNLSAFPQSTDQNDISYYQPTHKNNIFENIIELAPLKKKEMILDCLSHIEKNLTLGNVHQTLGEIPPITLSLCVSNENITSLSPKNFIYLLSFLVRFKYIKTISTTPSFDFLSRIINQNLDSLTAEEINILSTILSKLKIIDESLSLKLSAHIMKNADSYSPRCLANIMNSFAEIARKASGFIGFYEFMKIPITKKLLQNQFNDKDLAGIVRGYSKTYNLTAQFVEIISQKTFNLMQKRKIGIKEMSVICHSLNLNKLVFDSSQLWPVLREIFNEKHSSFNLNEFLNCQKVLKENNLFDKNDFSLLLNRIEHCSQEINLLDLNLIFELFFSFIEQNPKSFLNQEEAKNNRLILKLRYQKQLDILIAVFNKIHENTESNDILVYLKFSNFIIDHNTKDGHLFMGHLKFLIKKIVKQGIAKPSEKLKMREFILKFKDEKIQQVFLTKLT